MLYDVKAKRVQLDFTRKLNGILGSDVFEDRGGSLYEIVSHELQIDHAERRMYSYSLKRMDGGEYLDPWQMKMGIIDLRTMDVIETLSFELKGYGFCYANGFLYYFQEQDGGCILKRMGLQEGREEELYRTHRPVSKLFVSGRYLYSACRDAPSLEYSTYKYDMDEKKLEMASDSGFQYSGLSEQLVFPKVGSRRLTVQDLRTSLCREYVVDGIIDEDDRFVMLGGSAMVARRFVSSIPSLWGGKKAKVISVDLESGRVKWLFAAAFIPIVVEYFDAFELY